MRFGFPKRRVVRQFSKFFHQEDQKVEWMDHASDYSAGLHSAGLSPLTSKHPWCSYALHKNGQRVWKLCEERALARQSFAHWPKQNKSPENLSKGQNCRGQTATVTLYLGPGLWVPWRKDTNDTFRTKSIIWVKQTIGGAPCSLTKFKAISIEGWPQ